MGTSSANSIRFTFAALEGDKSSQPCSFPGLFDRGPNPLSLSVTSTLQRHKVLKTVPVGPSTDASCMQGHSNFSYARSCQERVPVQSRDEVGGIKALVADVPGAALTFQNNQCVECFDDCASFRLIHRAGDETSSHRILSGFDAFEQGFGVCFEDRGFVEFHPIVLRVHCLSPSRNKERYQLRLGGDVSPGEYKVKQLNTRYAGVRLGNRGLQESPY
jgi:hypothetical protein